MHAVFDVRVLRLDGFLRGTGKLPRGFLDIAFDGSLVEIRCTAGFVYRLYEDECAQREAWRVPQPNRNGQVRKEEFHSKIAAGDRGSLIWTALILGQAAARTAALALASTLHALFEPTDADGPGRCEVRPVEESTTPRPKRRGVWWWALVAVDMLMLLCGQTMGTLLGRLYYNSGGSSMWMATLAQSAGAPLLLVPLLLTPRYDEASASASASAAGEPLRPATGKVKVAAACVGIGLLVGCDNLMYSYAMLYLPVSTFNARLTALTLNSVVVLTFSAALLGVAGGSSDGTTSAASHVPPGKYALGFVLTLSASAAYALVLSLFEVTFAKVVRSRALRWVLTAQLCTGVEASAVSAAALLASGEWRGMRGEMEGFEGGAPRYVATLAGVAVGWQAATLGAVRLIARASSLFANVTSTLALPLVPVFGMVFFGDEMTGVKVVAMLMAVWGFLSYVYQHYLDDRRRASGRMGSQTAILPARDSNLDPVGNSKGVQASIIAGMRPPEPCPVQIHQVARFFARYAVAGIRTHDLPLACTPSYRYSKPPQGGVLATAQRCGSTTAKDAGKIEPTLYYNPHQTQPNR
ncbi:hypothetical protein HU200_027643 [Digitaria exilis]|uniref:Probable purine permease n=1 Tax=Digitaria exilis TaxID=1010633 RepID=A0A835BYF8_9POAL|nr:hypothetical protein HU200_027643 [Digitaria exilis]